MDRVSRNLARAGRDAGRADGPRGGGRRAHVRRGAARTGDLDSGDGAERRGGWAGIGGVGQAL